MPTAKPTLETLPADSRWRHISPDTIVRCTSVWQDPDAPEGDLHTLTGLRFRTFGVRWSGSINSGVSFTGAPGGFLLTVLSVLQQYSLKVLPQPQVEALKALPGLAGTTSISRQDLVAYWVNMSVADWAIKKPLSVGKISNKSLAGKLSHAAHTDAKPYFDGSASPGSKWAITKAAMHAQMLTAMALQWAQDHETETVLGPRVWTPDEITLTVPAQTGQGSNPGQPFVEDTSSLTETLQFGPSLVLPQKLSLHSKPSLVDPKSTIYARLMEDISNAFLDATEDNQRKVVNFIRISQFPEKVKAAGQGWIDILLSDTALMSSIPLTLLKQLQTHLRTVSDPVPQVPPVQSVQSGQVPQSIMSMPKFTKTHSAYIILAPPDTVTPTDLNSTLQGTLGQGELQPVSPFNPETPVTVKVTPAAAKALDGQLSIMVHGTVVPILYNSTHTDNPPQQEVTPQSEPAPTPFKGKGKGAKGKGKGKGFPGKGMMQAIPTANQCFGCGEDGHFWGKCPKLWESCTACWRLGHQGVVCSSFAIARGNYIKAFGHPTCDSQTRQLQIQWFKEGGTWTSAPPATEAQVQDEYDTYAPRQKGQTSVKGGKASSSTQAYTSVPWSSTSSTPWSTTSASKGAESGQYFQQPQLAQQQGWPMYSTAPPQGQLIEQAVPQPSIQSFAPTPTPSPTPVPTPTQTHYQHPLVQSPPDPQPQMTYQQWTEIARLQQATASPGQTVPPTMELKDPKRKRAKRNP